MSRRICLPLNSIMSAAAYAAARASAASAPSAVTPSTRPPAVTSAPEGEVIKVTYKDGEAEVTIPPGIPIVGYVPGDRSLLKPGAAVFIIAQKGADGSLIASGVTAEKDGVKPPM